MLLGRLKSLSTMFLVRMFTYKKWEFDQPIIHGIHRNCLALLMLSNFLKINIMFNIWETPADADSLHPAHYARLLRTSLSCTALVVRSLQSLHRTRCSSYRLLAIICS
ncbi:hypothetical protein CEXT_783131 [Caerostris extrusa]|uniref:Uncharacterized protein n=1 Tax=Caerostris extrusa TaxID=172846 RepID=A0AAV4WQQ6_CAEEX|nr:hypothetical protein CEXT_783131 [Caerostris extrusa]